MDLFIRKDIGCLHELPVNGDAAFVVDVGVGNSCPMDFTL
jgi:hypothetical protein